MPHRITLSHLPNRSSPFALQSDEPNAAAAFFLPRCCIVCSRFCSLFHPPSCSFASRYSQICIIGTRDSSMIASGRRVRARATARKVVVESIASYLCNLLFFRFKKGLRESADASTAPLALFAHSLSRGHFCATAASAGNSGRPLRVLLRLRSASESVGRRFPLPSSFFPRCGPGMLVNHSSSFSSSSPAHCCCIPPFVSLSVVPSGLFPLRMRRDDHY